MDFKDVNLFLFDLDDTLINTREAYTIAQEKAVRTVFPHLTEIEVSTKLPTLRWLCKLFGSGNVEQYMRGFLISFPSLFSPSDKTTHILVEAYNQFFHAELRCFKGVRTFLKQLADKKSRLCLISNGNQKSQFNKLEITQLNTFFSNEHCFISGNFKPEQKKPSPYMIQLACQITNTSPKKAIFFGNTESDILAGNLAGVSTVFFGASSSLPQNLPDINKPNSWLYDWREI